MTFFYVRSSDNYYFGSSPDPIVNPAYTEVPSKPPSFYYRWDDIGTQWIPLTQTEIDAEEAAQNFQPDANPAFDIQNFNTGDVASYNSTTRILEASGINSLGGVLRFQGERISSLDFQTAYGTNELTDAPDVWGQLGAMQLTSTNTAASWYRYQYILEAVGDANTTVGNFGVFINGTLNSDSVTVIEKTHGGGRIYTRMDYVNLLPASTLSLQWIRLSGGGQSLEVFQREFRIEQLGPIIPVRYFDNGTTLTLL